MSLASVAGNALAAPTEDDPHNVYAVAVDSLGYVHVMGNMHADPLRYVRSTVPLEISSWERAGVAGPTARVTYPQLVAVGRSLLFFRREGEAGDGAILLDVLDDGDRSWRHVGTILDGRPTGESPYLHEVAVDAAGVVHILFMWRADYDVVTNNDVGYARSADQGQTWMTSAGRPLSLPISHSESDIVIDTATRGSGLLNSGGFAVDGLGRPHGALVFDPPNGPRRVEHVWHDGTSWRREVVRAPLSGRPAVAAVGRLVWFVGTRCGVVAASLVAGGPARFLQLGAVPLRWEVSFDPILAREGRLEVLVPSGNHPRVLARRLLSTASDADPCTPA